MTQIEIYNQFCEAAMLNQKYDPWVRRRQFGKVYADFMIIKCRSENWWYKDFIGVEFFGEIYDKGYGEIEVTVIRLTNTQIHTGRDIPIGDLMML